MLLTRTGGAVALLPPKVTSWRVPCENPLPRMTTLPTVLVIAMRGATASPWTGEAIWYETLTVAGLPASCPVPHVGSFRQAETVSVPENVPGPSVLALTGRMVATPDEPEMLMNTFATTEPLTSALM